MIQPSRTTELINNISAMAITPKYCFPFFFAFYTLLGMCISYPGFLEHGNVVFMTDGVYVVPEIFDPEFSAHEFTLWHSSRHPIFVLLLQPVAHLINGIVGDQLLSMMFMVAFCGAASTCILGVILRELRISSVVALLFIAFYGFSFSSMIFFSLIESFAFNGLAVISTWCYALIIAKRTGELRATEIVIAVFLGTVTMGLTVTNLVSFTVSIAFLCFARKGLSHKIRAFALIVASSILMVVILAEIEVLAWPQYNRFYEPMIAYFFGGTDWETMHFVDSSFSLDKVPVWIKELILHPMISPEVQPVTEVGGTPTYAAFGKYGSLQTICSILFYALSVFSVIFSLTQLVKSKQWTISNIYFACLIGIVILNLCFHFFFNPQEGFIYAQNYLALMFATFAFAVDTIKRKQLWRALIIVLACILACAIVSNLCEFSKVTEIVWMDVGHKATWKRIASMTVAAGIISWLALRCWRYARTSISSNTETLTAWSIGAYLALILLYAAFLLFTNA